MKLYDFPKSGNCWKVRLMLGFLGLKAEIVPVNLLEGAQRSADFQALNPLSQVPVLVDEGQVIRDSHAIIFYLARRYDDTARWYPGDLQTQAEIAGWLSLSANELANGPSALRLIKVFGAPFEAGRARDIAETACAYIEEKLQGKEWLTGGTHPTIADLACYPYLALAHQGDFALEPYPRLRDWLARVESLEHYQPLEQDRAASLR